jgi:PBP1b-binding outer membrane lipoprotein LpoB
MKKKITLYVLFIIILLHGCSIVELVVENQATSRSISEAKRDPECSGEVDKQTSTRVRESSKDRSVDLTTEPL